MHCIYLILEKNGLFIELVTMGQSFVWFYLVKCIENICIKFLTTLLVWSEVIRYIYLLCSDELFDGVFFKQDSKYDVQDFVIFACSCKIL